jgi:S-adenosylmethionine decarboxylase
MESVGNGEAWAVDAFGCDPTRLRSSDALASVFRALVDEVGLHPLREPVWHAFPEPGGVTGFLLLRESHLAVHTFPERGFAAFDLYCCRPRAAWRWGERLAHHLGADRVVVRRLARGEPSA